jgi:hypothetical protein
MNEQRNKRAPKVSDAVRKVSGSYEREGVLVSEFYTPDGQPRVVVARPVGKG